MSYIDQITVGLTTYDIQDSTVPAWARASNAPQGLPSGGTTGQALVKHSNSNYDIEWVDVGGGDVQTVNNISPDTNGNVLITADDISTDAINISVQDVIDDSVHVGASAPTNPTTKFWLDTDASGETIVGVPSNGTSGQVLTKVSDDDYDISWSGPHILQANVQTITANGTTSNISLTGLTANHVIGNWGMFSDSNCTTPIPENAPTCDITITTNSNSWSVTIANFTSTFYLRPTFILYQN